MPTRPLLAVVLLLTGWNAVARAADPPATLLFDSGKEGYPRYRIPALLRGPGNTLLAFIEGRKDGRGLQGNIDIVLKRSTDDGQTWQPLQVVADDDSHTLGNPCPVVDRDRGVVWLALTRSHGKDTEEEIVAGRSRETTRVLLTHSRDDGRTWAPLRDITAAVRQPNWTWYGTGPGIGIQLRSGRLLIPCYHAEKPTGTYHSHCIYSDDHGETWKRGGTVAADLSECQAAERRDGSLLLSARTLKGEPRRTIAISKDGGATWSAVARDPALYDPSCQAALYRFDSLDAKEPPRWLCSHPAGPDGRRNLTVRLSRDEGKTWPAHLRLRTGDSQYSCLTRLSNNTVGCLYESWVDGNYRIFFTRFGLDELADR